MDIKYLVITEDDFIKSVWSGGTTEQIYIYPADAAYKDADFLFRISRASVDIMPSDFTKIPGVKRFIMPLDSSLTLTHDNKNDIKLKPFESYEFSAETDTKSKSIAKDFNLMLANGAAGDMKSVYLEINHPFIYKNDKEISDISRYENEAAGKYFTGFYTQVEGITIDIDGQSINLPAYSLFLAESDKDIQSGKIRIISKTCSYIIVIRVYIKNHKQDK